MKLPQLKIGDLVAELPIVLGGMGIGISGSKLAAAFANEGGIGVISGVNIGYNEPDFKTNHFMANLRALRREIKKAKADCSQGLIGVNFMVAMNRYKDYVRAAVDEGVDLIVSGAGLPLDLPEFVKGSKTKIVPIVSSARAAGLIAKVWDKNYQVIPDAVVIEGVEAGGHLGFKPDEITAGKFSLKDTLRDVLNVLKPYEEKYQKEVPVIIGGGIYTGEQIAEYLEAGASGVQMSTRFVATQECDAAQAFKDMYINAQKEDVEIIVSPVGMPGRALNNKFLQRLKEGIRPKIQNCSNCLKTCNPETTPYCISQALICAAQGNVDDGVVFCGSNVYKVDKMSTVKQILHELVTEAEKRYKQ